MKRVMILALLVMLCFLISARAGGNAVMELESFDGGGPEFHITVEDPTIVTWTSRRQYDNADHEEMTGSGYREIYTFMGLKKGTTRMTLAVHAPLEEDYEADYILEVDEDLNVTYRRAEKEAPIIEETKNSPGDFFRWLMDFIEDYQTEKQPACEKIVGEDIGPDDIEDFYYTLDASSYPPRYTRYHFYTQEGERFFAYEKREGYNWPLTEEDVTEQVMEPLDEETWAAFYETLRGGSAHLRSDAVIDGDDGPFIYLYWRYDEARYQEFSFPSRDRLGAFVQFCEDLVSRSHR